MLVLRQYSKWIFIFLVATMVVLFLLLSFACVHFIFDCFFFSCFLLKSAEFSSWPLQNGSNKSSRWLAFLKCHFNNKVVLLATSFSFRANVSFHTLRTIKHSGKCCNSSWGVFSFHLFLK